LFDPTCAICAAEVVIFKPITKTIRAP